MHRVVSSQVRILTLLCLLLWPATASAQSQDQLLVADSAGIFGDRLHEVQEAAEQLQSQGADVRVRTIVSYGPFGNLDQYEQELELDSPSWLGANGDRKNNLIVLIICLQDGGQTGLYYGEYWEDVLGDRWLSIQADVMNPLFRDGDYAGGAIAGLQEIGRLVEDGGSAEGGDGGTGGTIAWTFLLAIAVVVGALIGVVLFASHRKSQARRLAVRQKAMLTKQAAASGINELIETIQMLEIKVDVTGNKVALEEAAPLHAGLVEARRLVDRSSQSYSELSHSAGDPENPRLGEAELGAIEPEYRNILDILRQARDTIKSVEAQIGNVQEIVDGFPGKVARVNAAMDEAEGKRAQLTLAGFNTTYVADLLAQVHNTLGMSQDLASKKRFKEATEFVSRAETQVLQAAQAAEELPHKKLEAESAVPVLATRLKNVAVAVEDAKALFEILSQAYAETTWVAIRGNGTEAETRLNWAEDALDDARAAVAMEQQEWHKALELVATGDGWLTEAELLVNAISELEADLVAARRDAPAEILAARADVARAWEYINRHDDDIRESLEDDLRTAETMLSEADEELTQEKPDYLRVFKLARKANDAADHILIQARDEHEAAIRLREKAASAVRDAKSKVAMVSRFVQVRHPFVKDHARNRLVEATEALRQAEMSTDVGTQLSLAQRAESAADEAYSLAQRDLDSSGSTSQPTPASGAGTPTMNKPALSFPTGSSSGGGRPWGSKPSSSPRTGGSARRGGGGSTRWSSGGGSRGGRSSGRGGGSTGW